MSLKDVIEFFHNLLPRWNTKRGLLLFVVVDVAAYFLLPLQVALSPTIRIAVFSAAMAAYIFAWVFSRYWPKRNRWIVLFALESDPQADEYLRKAMRGARSRIAAIPTKNPIRLERFHHENVPSKRDAERIVELGRADIVIWGTFGDALKDGEPFSAVEIINYTHRMTPAMRKNLARYERDLKAVLDARQWQVRHKHSFDDIIRLQSNFVESCLFILAVQMFTTPPAVEDSISLFQFLLNTAASAGQNELAQRLHIFLVQAVFLQMCMRGDAGDWQAVRRYAKQLIEMGVSGLPIESSLARACFELGDEEDARSHVQRMAEIDPNDSNTLFDQAFFHLLDREYARARDLYDRLHRLNRLNRLNAIPQQIVDFFSARLRAKTADPAFLYARGVVALWYTNRDAGIHDLNAFLRQVEGQQTYQPLIVHANELLKDACTPNKRKTRRKKPHRRKR